MEQRAGYDKVWGGLLALTCVMPYRFGGDGFLWDLYVGTTDRWLRAWLVIGSLAGVTGLVMGLASWQSRWRHFLNLGLGAATLGLPIFQGVIWRSYPEADPSQLPLAELGSFGWVMLIATVAIYCGSGIRIVRPSFVAGQALGALGALTLAAFAFLPLEGRDDSLALMHLKLVTDFGAHWRLLVPLGLVSLATVLAVLNLLRSRAEVRLAQMTRLLLVGALIFWIALPFIESTDRLADHLPDAWGLVRFFSPLFLALDGCIAFFAITAART